MFEDIANLTGGRVIAEEIGVMLENVDSEWPGDARKVVIDKGNTQVCS